MRIEDVMTEGVRTVGPQASAAEARTLMESRGTHHLVVVDDGRVVGVVSQRDLGGRNAAAFLRDKRVSDLMSARPVTVTPEDTVRRAANVLRGRSIGCLPVVDRRERLVGIVTISDLLDLIGKDLAKPVVRSKRWTLKHRGPRGR
jgi:acetoin utilization protein AcuB